MSARETHLEDLAVELKQRGFAVSIRQREGRPATLTVINPQAPVLTETVLVASDVDEELAYFFPWPAKIAPVTELAAAAERIERVLGVVDR